MSADELGGSADQEPGVHGETASDREARLGRVLSDYADRVNAGEHVETDEILAAHPELAGDLALALEGLEALRPAVDDSNEPLGTLGDYTLQRQIGRGGMGVVYEAWQESLDRQVALKVLPAGVAADDKAFHRFMREAKTAARLSHPNVVSVYGMGVEQNTPYYSMECVDGETLAEILAREKVARPEEKTAFGFSRDDVAYYSTVARCFADVADGLQHAHSKGVIHRDVKPSNLILDAEGRLRVLDFGLARLEGLDSLTISGNVVGTPLYMSPEQAKRRRIPIDHRTDVYSLGATMYELLAGRPPFQGKSHADTLSQIIERDPPQAKRFNPRVPRDLETIVLKCLRKEPGDRYGTAEALSQDLRRFVRGDPVEARPEPTWGILFRRLRRHKALATAIVCALLLVATTSSLVVNHFERIQDANEDSYGRLVRGAVVKLALAEESRSDRVSTGRSTDRKDIWTGLAEGAVHELEDAVDLFPARPEARYHLASALHVLGRDVQAEQALEGLDLGFLPAAVLRSELETEGRDRLAETTGSFPPEARTGWEHSWYSAYRAMKAEQWKEAAEAYRELMEGYRRDGEGFLGMDIEARLARGRAYLRQEDFESALIDFAVAAELWPELMEPPFLIGKTYLHMDRPGKAEEIFQRIHSAAPFPDKVAHWIIQAYHDREDMAEALEWANRINDRATAERERAHLLSHLHRLDDALEAARKSLELEPDQPDVYTEIGHALGKQKKLDEAISWFDTALKLYRNWPVTDDTYFDIASAHERRGMAYLAKSEFRKAVEDLTEAIQLGSPSSRRARGYYHYFRGLAYNQLDEPEKAITDFTEAIRLDPRADSYNCRAFAYKALGKLAESTADFTKAIQLDATNPLFLRNRSGFYKEIGETDKAIADLTQAIRLDPKRALDYHNLGALYYGKADYESAIVDMTKALQLDPESAFLYQSRGNVYAAWGRFNKAARDLGESIRLKPDESSSWLSRAFVQLAVGEIEQYRATCREMLDRFAEDEEMPHALDVAWTCVLLPDAVPDLSPAISVASGAVEGNPGSRSRTTVLGAALYRAGRLEDAARRLAEAARLMEDSAFCSRISPEYCWFFLAMTHHRLGREEEARRFWEKGDRWMKDVDRQGAHGASDAHDWPDRVGLRILREEVRTLLSISESSSRPGTTPRGHGSDVAPRHDE